MVDIWHNVPNGTLTPNAVYGINMRIVLVHPGSPLMLSVRAAITYPYIVVVYQFRIPACGLTLLLLVIHPLHIWRFNDAKVPDAQFLRCQTYGFDVIRGPGLHRLAMVMVHLSKATERAPVKKNCPCAINSFDNKTLSANRELKLQSTLTSVSIRPIVAWDGYSIFRYLVT